MKNTNLVQIKEQAAIQKVMNENRQLTITGGALGNFGIENQYSPNKTVSKFRSSKRDGNELRYSSD